MVGEHDIQLTLKMQVILAHVELPRLHLVQRLLLGEPGPLLLGHLDPNAMYLKSNVFKIVSKSGKMTRRIGVLQGGAHGIDPQRQEPQFVCQDGQCAALRVLHVAMDDVKDFIQLTFVLNERCVGARHRQQPPHQGLRPADLLHDAGRAHQAKTVLDATQAELDRACYVPVAGILGIHALDERVGVVAPEPGLRESRSPRARRLPGAPDALQRLNKLPNAT